MIKRVIKYLLLSFAALFVILFAIALVGSIKDATKMHAERSKKAAKVQASLPKYTIHQRKVEDVKVKTQVTIEVIVPDCTDRNELKTLLTYLYNKEAESTGYDHRTHPNAVYIRLWRSTNDFGNVSPFASLDKAVVYDSPVYVFDDERLAALNTPSDYLGLSEDQRRAVWDGYTKIMTDLLAAAQKAHPEASNLYQWIDFGSLKKAQADLIASHKISDKQFNKILAEGKNKGWPEETAP